MISSTTVRLVVVYQDQRKIALISSADTLQSVMENFKKLYKIPETHLITLWNPIFKAEIDDPTIILPNDEIEIHQQKEAVDNLISINSRVEVSNSFNSSSNVLL